MELLTIASIDSSLAKSGLTVGYIALIRAFICKTRANKMTVRSLAKKQPVLGQGVYIDPAATVIGDVQLGDHCSVWPGAVIRGDMHEIRIGQGCSIQDGSVLHITHASQYNPQGHPLHLGDQVTVGHMVCLHGCRIGNQVLLGIGSIVLDGAVIEDQVVLGAGSLVPPGKRLASGYLYLGRPAKQVRPLSPEELAYFAYSAQNYQQLKDQYLAETNQ